MPPVTTPVPDPLTGPDPNHRSATAFALDAVGRGTGGAPPLRSQHERRRRLATMKRRATLLLVAVTVVFVAITVFGPKAGWDGYVQAMAEAAMVGALADWFAVTALFRHPLGLPIPHTAVVVERKDQFASTLGEFIQESFLTPEAIVARLRRAELIPRMASWLDDEEHARRVAAEMLDGAVTVADLMHDDDVHRVIERLMRERVESVPLSPLAGKALSFAIRDGRHQQALESGLRELDNYLDTHRDELRMRLGERSPWWLPGAAEDRIFERLIEGARTVVKEMLDDTDHSLRQRFEARLLKLVEDLETSPEYLEKGEKLKQEMLAHPMVNEWVTSMWVDAKAMLRAEAENPDSALRDKLSGMVMAVGRRLRDDPVLAEKLEASAETGVTYVVERFRGEIVDLVTDTISKWDATETADRLELLLGPDLQYIRINGTVVGALAGLVLHSIAELLG